jgi:hypothetical protein
MKPQLKRPSPGTALGLLALIVALVGTANASSTHIVVHRGDIAPGAVTSRSLAKGAVRTKKLANGAVTAAKLATNSVDAAALANEAVTTRTIKAGAVVSASLAPDAVTAAALAPGSVYGGALGPVTLHTAPMADLDAVAENGTWTASDTGVAVCSPGEKLLTGGVAFSNPGNREVSIIEAIPAKNPGSVESFVGRVVSNSGGTATAEVQAICLK